MTNEDNYLNIIVKIERLVEYNLWVADQHNKGPNNAFRNT